MKKILKIIIFLCLAIFTSNIAFGEGDNKCETSCKIKDGPAETLDNYLLNLKKVISNVTYEIGNKAEKQDGKTKGLSGDFSSIKDKVFGIFNNTISWGNYYTDFDFFIMYSMKQEYVNEVWRDYNLLEQESLNLDKFFKYATTRGANLELTKDAVCKGVTASCDFKGNSLDVLGEIIKNHNDFKTYYKLSILGKKNEFSGSLQLVDSDFEKKFGEFYNENTSPNCSKCTGGNWAKVIDMGGRISEFQENASKGIQSWKDAINMLRGNLDLAKQAEAERKLLEKELARNGTSANASENILKNLDKFNASGLTFDNNFITNSFEYLKNSIGNQFDDFKQTITNLSGNNKTNTNLPKRMSNSSIVKENEKIAAKNEIENLIDELYKKEVDLALMQDINAENFQSRLIKMHINLSIAIKTLDKTKEVSKKVCSEQAAGRGDCNPTK